MNQQVDVKRMRREAIKEAVLKVRLGCRELMYREPFYGTFLAEIEKDFSFDKLDTAGVCIMRSMYKMYFNPYFVQSATPEEVSVLVEHEISHIVWGHCEMREEYPDHAIGNIAQDLEINQHLNTKNLPMFNGDLKEFKKFLTSRMQELKKAELEGTMHPEEIIQALRHKELMYPCLIEDYFPKDLKKGSKWYYKKLKEQQEQQDSKSSSGELGDQEELEDIGSLIEKILEDNGIGRNDVMPSEDFQGNAEQLTEVDKEILKKTVAKALDKASKENGGGYPATFPADIDRWVQAQLLEKEESVDWRTWLSMFIQGSIRSYSIPTRKRPSKRYPAPSPGLKTKTNPTGIIYWDQSGSVSDKEHELLFSELQHIYKNGVDLYIAPFNCHVLEPYKYDGESEYCVTGGGTNFDVCQQHFEQVQEDYAFAIMFTDGHASVPKNRFAKPVMWIITQETGFNENFPGEVVLMKKDNINQ